MTLILLILLDTGRRAPPDWYPLRVGATWTYSGNGFAYTRTVVGEKKIGMETWIEVETRFPNARVQRDWFTRDRDGIRYRACGSGGSVADFDPPRLILKTPLGIGDKWNDSSSEYEVAGDEVRDVLGRKISCRKVVGRSKGKGHTQTVELWYAAGVGVVRHKSVTAMEGELFTNDVVLKEFKP